MEAIVVTHNSRQDLEGLLASRATLDAFDRIVVVDNASTDDSVALCRAAGLEVHARTDNDGFGAGVNCGAALLDAASFAILNPDIRLGSDEPVRLAQRQFADSPSLGVIGPRLMLPDGSVQDSARAIPTPRNLLRRRLIEESSGRIRCEEPCAVPWVVAACMFVRREAFEAIGGFDDAYFLYFEDVDLCVRMRRAGWEVRYDPTAAVEHRHRAASRAQLSSWATRQHMKSAMRFFARNPRYAAGALVTAGTGDRAGSSGR